MRRFRFFAPALLCFACAVDWAPLGCSSESAAPNDGTHDGDTTTNASVYANIPCNSLPVGVATQVPLVAQSQTSVVTCSTNDEGCGGSSDHKCDTNVLSKSAGPPVPLDVAGIANVTCDDDEGVPIATCDATVTYANSTLTVSKPTPGTIDVTMNVADAGVPVEQLLSFIFSNTPSCDIDGGAEASSAVDATIEAASDATNDSQITDAGALDDSPLDADAPDGD